MRKKYVTNAGRKRYRRIDGRASRPSSNDRAAELSRTQSAGESFSAESSKLGEPNDRRGALSTNTHAPAKAGGRFQGRQDQQPNVSGGGARNQDLGKRRRLGNDIGKPVVDGRRRRLLEARLSGDIRGFRNLEGA